MNPFRRRSQTAMQQGGGGTAFSPTDIAGLQLWLDASQITGLNDGDAVATWPDVSGFARDFSQSTASRKPVFKTNQRGSLPAVLFDGADDYLTATFSCTAKTIVVVYKVTGGVQYSRPVDFNPGQKCVYRDTSNTIVGTYSGVFGPTLSGVTTGFMVATFTFDASGSGLRIDGVDATPVAGAFGTALAGTHGVGAESGGNYNLSGYVAHVLLYDTVLSSTYIGQLETYFSTH